MIVGDINEIVKIYELRFLEFLFWYGVGLELINERNLCEIWKVEMKMRLVFSGDSCSYMDDRCEVVVVFVLVFWEISTLLLWG